MGRCGNPVEKTFYVYNIRARLIIESGGLFYTEQETARNTFYKYKAELRAELQFPDIEMS